MTARPKRIPAAPEELSDPWTILAELRADAKAFAESLDDMEAMLGPRPECSTRRTAEPAIAAETPPIAVVSSHRGSALSPDVRAVLDQAAFADGVLKLPPGQLERKLYVAVNDAVEALGGKWNRKVGGHVFSTDGAARLIELLSSGIVPPKNPDAYFPTPSAVVDAMLELADLDHPALRVLEPSAGEGAIAMAVARRCASAVVHCVEVNSDRATALSNRGLLHVWHSDFLTWDGGAEDYDRILMNPPFAVEGDATAWMTHVQRALSTLNGRGTLVSIVPSGFAFRHDRKHVAFREVIGGRFVYQPLPPDAFKASGTGVSTGLLVVRGALA